MSAGVDPQDCCPRCGTPYLGLLKAGEPPSNRYCDVCKLTAAQAVELAQQDKAAHQQGEEELALEPLAGEEKPQSGSRPPRLAPPRHDSRQPTLWNRARWLSPRHGADAAKALAVRMAVLSALVIAGFFAYQVGWPYVKRTVAAALSSPPAKVKGQTAATHAARRVKSEPGPKRESQGPRTPDEATAPPSSVAAPVVESRDVVGLATTKAPATAPTETQDKPSDAPKTEPSAKPAAAPAKKTDDVVDDEDLEAKRTAGRAAKPEAVKGKATQKKDEPADAASVLGLGKKGVDQAAPAKAPTPVIAAGTEPAIVPFDAQKMDSGKDKSFTMMLANVLPGWHCKDVNNTNSSVGAKHRGRDGVLVLSPINDVLPVKLMAAIDVPLKSKVKLLFEVSSKDAGHEWLLSATVANAPIYQKVPIRTQDPLVWREVPLDLSECSGKRVEVVLETAMRPKTPANAYKEQTAYLRNIRLDWPGKPQGPQKPAEEPKAQPPAEEKKPQPPVEEPKTQP